MSAHSLAQEYLNQDFSVLFRLLLHATRMPACTEDASSCILERYHTEAMVNGERIRGGLSAEELYHPLLRLVYRLLFLLSSRSATWCPAWKAWTASRTLPLTRPSA